MGARVRRFVGDDAVAAVADDWQFGLRPPARPGRIVCLVVRLGVRVFHNRHAFTSMNENTLFAALFAGGTVGAALAPGGASTAGRCRRGD